MFRSRRARMIAGLSGLFAALNGMWLAWAHWQMGLAWSEMPWVLLYAYGPFGVGAGICGALFGVVYWADKGKR